MLPAPAPIRLPPPAAAVAAAVLAVLSATVPGFLGLILLAMYEGEEGAAKWVWVLVPAGLVVALVVGAVLLLLGRSWLAVVLPAYAVAAIAVLGMAGGGSIRVPGVLAITVPLAAALLGARPVVRRWVRDRRASRLAPEPFLPHR
jgi:hypothetical protein